MKARARKRSSQATWCYPFTAIVGQEEMKLSLVLNVIDPLIGGVLIMGHRGTGKSTAVRALASLLPPLTRIKDCPYNCDPRTPTHWCADCQTSHSHTQRIPTEQIPVPVVDLPLGATEDRVCGALDVERALRQGTICFEPGLLARANRGFLYIDEVNLLEDHLVDLLLDVAASGQNVVEREGISIRHPARFVLVGSGNPEEGELRPQLLDRFGLFSEVETILDLDQRVEIVQRREWFERDFPGFADAFASEQGRLQRTLKKAQRLRPTISVPAELQRWVAEICVRLRVDGHRGELTMVRAARALAAFEGRREVNEADIRRTAVISLRHRLRRDPLDSLGGAARIEQALGGKTEPPQRRIGLA